MLGELCCSFYKEKVLQHTDIVHGSETEMDSSELEDLKLEVGDALYTLTRDALIEVCYFRTIAGPKFENVSGKSCSSLISYVTRHREKR